MSDLEIPGAGGSANVSDAAYDATAWDGDTDAPTKNAVRDKIETLGVGHDPVTVTDSDEINFTLTGQGITAVLKAGSIVAGRLATAVQTSLGKADNALPKAGGTMTGNIALNGNYLSGDGGDEGVFVDSSGNVGIGTASPDETVHIYSANNAYVRFESAINQSSGFQMYEDVSGTPYGFSLFYDGGRTNDFLIQSKSHSALTTKVTIKRDTGNFGIGGDPGTAKLYVNGNVGIGTTAPDTKLHVAGAMTQEPLSSDPADPDAGNSVQWVSDGTGSGDAGDVMMKINVGGTTKVITLIDYSVA